MLAASVGFAKYDIAATPCKEKVQCSPVPKFLAFPIELVQ